ncbi:ABC transporter permease [Halobacteriovorax sp.]|uniref:ABC transporter permease n=1 Tax=Halobacteriovorax sp. TaxID=2020862 RepID=UPI00356A2864
MLKFILKKLLDLIPTLVGISILSFILIRLVPGDPVMLMLGERGADPIVYAKMQKALGLDLPMHEQYVSFLSKAFNGDLGTSIVSKRSVTSEFFARFPATLELGLCAIAFAAIVGIPFGILAAIKRNSFYDYFLMGGSLVGYSMPIFWWGLILILFFSVQLGITPVSGRISIMYDVEVVTGFMLIDTLLPRNLASEGIGPFLSTLSHLILPAIAMGTIPLAVMARMTRSSMLEVLGEDYIRTAKAKGLPIRKIIGVHALRNALIPIVTVIGLIFGSIITGAILTETIFSWPGIGKWLVASINARDYPVIQGGVLFIATMIVLINLMVDFIYAIVNPKMR